MRNNPNAGQWNDVVLFGRGEELVRIPDLVELQTRYYENFLQKEVAPERRQMLGLHSIIHETFPIPSFDGKYQLQYVRYRLGKPRYTPDECRNLKLTFGAPFYLQLRLVGPTDTVEEEVYLGEMPLMIGGGEFIINGAERVIVTQLHRSPGVDFQVELTTGDKKLHSCWVIPERGSWIEINVTKKDTLSVRIDQSSKFSAMTLLRSMWESDDAGRPMARYSSNEDIVRRFYSTKVVPLGDVEVPDKLDAAKVIADFVDGLKGVQVRLPERVGLGDRPGMIEVQIPPRVVPPTFDPVPTKLVKIDRPEPFNAQQPSITSVVLDRENESLEDLQEAVAGFRLAEDIASLGLEADQVLTDDDLEKIWEETGIRSFQRHEKINLNQADAAELAWSHEHFQTGFTEKRIEKFLENREVANYFTDFEEARGGTGVPEGNAATWSDIFYLGQPLKMPDAKPSEKLIEDLVGWRLAEELHLASGRTLLRKHRLTEKDVERIHESRHLTQVKIFTRVNLNDAEEEELSWTEAKFKTGLTPKRAQKLYETSRQTPFKDLAQAQKGIGLSAPQARAWDLVFVAGPAGEGAASPQAPPSFTSRLVGFELAQAIQLDTGELVHDGTVLSHADATKIYVHGKDDVVYLWQLNLNEVSIDEVEHVNEAYDLKLQPAQMKAIGKSLEKARPFRGWESFSEASGIPVRTLEAKFKPYFFAGADEKGDETKSLAGVLDQLVGRRLSKDVLGVGGKIVLPRFLELTSADVEMLFRSTSVPLVEVLRPEDAEYFHDKRAPGSTTAGEPDKDAILERLLKPKKLKVGPKTPRKELAGKFTYKPVHPTGSRQLLDAFEGIPAAIADEMLTLTVPPEPEKGKKKKDEEVRPPLEEVTLCGYVKREWIQPGIKKGTVKASEKKRLVDEIVNRTTVSAIIDPASQEILVDAFLPIQQAKAEAIINSGIAEIEVIEDLDDSLILNSLAEDPSTTHEDALMRIYARLRPGNPPNLEKARQLFREKFMDETRYKLGRVGRFRLNRKFGSDIEEDMQVLQQEDVANAIEYLLKLRRSEGEVEGAETDDIDHLGNRRVKTIDELAGDELRKGFLKLKKNVQDRMQIDSTDAPTPRNLINIKTISSAINFFFGRSELSQVVDQTNPLSQLTHERRLSALGPGGLNRKRAGFEVRDVHISHYGRICPIETPEGTNIGLISSLAAFAHLDQYGFLTTPYRVVKNNVVTGEIQHLRADQEADVIIAPADIELDSQGRIIHDLVMAREKDEFKNVPKEQIQYIDVSPKQMVGVSAALIPFLEHDDANRALMGSNMQRQAVPLLRTEPPRVATGMEKHVARHSGMVITAKRQGTISYADATRIDVTAFANRKAAEAANFSTEHADALYTDSYELRKFVGLNERTCLNQKPIVKVGDEVQQGQVIADGAATHRGELSLGKNVLVAFMPWDGYNFEDAIIVSEELVQRDVYTSIHIDEFEVEIRETKLGREEFTREIPHVSEKARKSLDERGIVRVGTRVSPGDILVGKVAPKSKSELTPEEKLLYAIFGKAGEDVKNDSLDVPSGVEGIVIHTQHFSRKSPSDEDRSRKKTERGKVEGAFMETYSKVLREAVKELEKIAEGGKLTFKDDQKRVAVPKDKGENGLKAFEIRLALENLNIPARKEDKAIEILQKMKTDYDDADEVRFRQINRLEKGDELPTGVLEMVKVFVATRRTLSVGDKFAGRHGNKGVVSRILPVEDMPFLKDGTPVQMMLNPLGVPSRMNIGQILEIHLGWAAHELGIQAVTPVFDGCTEAEIDEYIVRAGLPTGGKAQLYDGRTGEPFDQRTTTGYLYMLKLHHLVDDKVHARATGPYSLITQQPLGGKARFGGQRFGEMEVWALEAYGAAHTLQELLTVKSDDVDGRTKIYESMVKGNNVLEPGTPVSFDVLTHEIKGLALNMELNKKSVFGEDVPVAAPVG